jgi:hypothetical protein
VAWELFNYQMVSNININKSCNAVSSAVSGASLFPNPCVVFPTIFPRTSRNGRYLCERFLGIMADSTIVMSLRLLDPKGTSSYHDLDNVMLRVTPFSERKQLFLDLTILLT